MTTSVLQRGTESAGAAAGLSALLYVPVGIVTLLRHPPTAPPSTTRPPPACSPRVIPFLADLLTLRRSRPASSGSS